MIRINLLPIRQIKQRQRARQEVIALAAALLVVLGVIGLLGFQQARRIASLQAETAQIKKDTEKFKDTVSLIEKIKKEQKIIEERMEVIKDLKTASQLPARVLDEISRLTAPDRMWLTSLDYTNNVIVLAGTALDNATIAEFMNKIGSSDYFQTAELKNSSLLKVGNQKLKSFTMTVNVLASLIPVAKPTPPPGKAGAKAAASKPPPPAKK